MIHKGIVYCSNHSGIAPIEACDISKATEEEIVACFKGSHPQYAWTSVDRRIATILAINRAGYRVSGRLKQLSDKELWLLKTDWSDRMHLLFLWVLDDTRCFHCREIAVAIAQLTGKIAQAKSLCGHHAKVWLLEQKFRNPAIIIL